MKISKQLDRLRLGAQEVRKRLPGHRPGLYYVVPEANWSIDWDGHYITKGVREQFPLKAELCRDPRWLSGQLLHYGSLWSFLGNQGAAHNARNPVVVTVFHGSRDASHPKLAGGIERLLGAADEIERLVVSNSIMRQRFLEWGFPERKLRCIPLGVDLALFRPASEKQRQTMRDQLSIAEDAFCIGSFQKDGEGWEEGLQPKLVKGPDLFVAAMRELSKRHKLHVLLTGPARGYVKAELEQAGIPFTHRLLDDYEEIVDYYAALDAYMVSSREEGGPKGVLESLACGLPLVSSRVGLAPDVVEHGVHGLLVENEDAKGLATAMARIIEDADLRQGLKRAGLRRIQAYDWKKVAASYYREVYQPLLEDQ